MLHQQNIALFVDITCWFIEKTKCCRRRWISNHRCAFCHKLWFISRLIQTYCVRTKGFQIIKIDFLPNHTSYGILFSNCFVGHLLHIYAAAFTASAHKYSLTSECSIIDLAISISVRLDLSATAHKAVSVVYWYLLPAKMSQTVSLCTHHHCLFAVFSFCSLFALTSALHGWNFSNTSLLLLIK